MHFLKVQICTKIKKVKEFSVELPVKSKESNFEANQGTLFSFHCHSSKTTVWWSLVQTQ